MPTRERIESPFHTREAMAAGDPTPRLDLRPLTGWEEEYLERHAQEPNTARLCNEVLARCLIAPGADTTAALAAVRALLVAERDRELVALRRLSLGPRVTARVPCAVCGEESETEFSLDVLPLEFEVPPAAFDVAIEGAAEVRLRLPTAGDQADLADAGLEGNAERRSWLLARCLERYGDRTDGFDLDFARGLPVAVRAALEAAIEQRQPDLDLQMAVECAHCGAEGLAPFDVPVFFFSS